MQIISLKTTIPFRKRTRTEAGEQFKVRDGAGRIVESWECVGVGNGKVEFEVEGYSDTSFI